LKDPNGNIVNEIITHKHDDNGKENTGNSNKLKED